MRLGKRELQTQLLNNQKREKRKGIISVKIRVKGKEKDNKKSKQ